MLRELRRIAEERIDDETMQASIGQICGHRVMSEETSSAQANQLAALHALGGFETVSQFRAAVSAVTAADVQRVAEFYLNSGSYNVIVRPRKTE
jgi:predicted Zn-dependent peptidase